MILYQDLPYVQDLTNSTESKKKIKSGVLPLMKKYTMKDNDFVSTDEDDNINVEIQNVTPKQQEHKTEEQLMGKFTKNEIVKIEKKTQTESR